MLAGDLPDVRGGRGTDKVAREVARTVRGMQSAAATLRAAWRAAASVELARRAEREGGAEGRRWRGVGMERWKQATRAKEGQSGLVGHGHDGECDAGTDAAGERGGWTMAAALIAYKTREMAARRRREHQRSARREVQACVHGTGVVVFDLETTELVDEATPVEAMEVSEGCTATTGEGVQRSTHWQRAALFAGQRDLDDSVEKLLEVFDSAKVIVAYNGRDFDMAVLKRYYGGDEGRWEAHMRKLHDPMWAALRAGGGRRPRLSTLLALNGLRGKQGVGCDAPALWRTGRLEQLERYCARDAEALAELVMLRNARVPGGAARTRWACDGGWTERKWSARAPWRVRTDDADQGEGLRRTARMRGDGGNMYSTMRRDGGSGESGSGKGSGTSTGAGTRRGRDR